MGYYDFEKTSDYIKFAKKIDKFAGRIMSEIQLLIQDNSVRASRRKYKFCMYAPEKVEKTHLSNNLQDGTVGIVGIVCDTAENMYYKENLNYRKNPTNPTNYTTPKKAKKSDREVQFLDAKECQNIKANCTIEEVLDWIKTNPGKTITDFYAALGDGSFKFLAELTKANKVKQENDMLELIL